MQKEFKLGGIRYHSQVDLDESKAYNVHPFVLPEEEELAREAVSYALTTQP